MSDEVSDQVLWNKLLKWLHAGIVRVDFNKKDGTKRVMNCTLTPDAYEEYEFKGSDNVNTQSVTIPVWETDLKEWRSIRKGSINSIELIETNTLVGD